MPVKTCNQCGAVKALTEFYKDKTKKGGYKKQCKACVNKVNLKYRIANKDAVNQMSKDWVNRNSERRKEIANSWSRRNPEWGRLSSAKRRATKLHATPAWADQEAITAIYKEARRLQEVLGIPMHVDHLVPLQGELVCGLHVETNLAIIPAALNLKKSNKFKVQ